MALPILNMLSQFSGIKDKAPQLLGEFLTSLIEKHEGKLNATAGETELIYIMHPAPKDEDKNRFIISIVAIDSENRIKRVIESITLKDAVQAILNNLPNA